MLKALVITNGTHGSENAFISTAQISYAKCEVSEDFNPDLNGYDLLIAATAVDHIALYKIKDKIKQFLNAGNAFFCFSGWYTNYVPGNQWYMNSDLKSIDLRYYAKSDSHKLLEGVTIDELIYENNISGWWACGYIKPAEKAEVVLEDTLKRAIVIVDEHSTAGTIVCTAGGPLSDRQRGDKPHATTVLYQNMVNFIQRKKQVSHQLTPN